MPDVPITFAQRFIYEVIEKLGPQASALQVFASVRIKGPIDIERFQLAAEVLAERIPILHAVLEVKQGRPIQRLGTSGPVFQVIEKIAADDRLASSILSKVADDPINVFTGSPLRIVILTTGPDQAFLLFVGHHLFLDATALSMSLGVYLKIYADIAERGRPIITGTHGYPDFFEYAVDEQKLLLDGTYDKRSEFWLRELENGDPELHLKGRGSDPEMVSSASMPFQIKEELITAIRKRAVAAGISIFAILTNSILYTLWEFVDQENLALSVVSDTRTPPFDRSVGQFADIFVVCQSKYDRGLDARATQLLADKLLGVIVNRVPVAYFRNDIPWLLERASNGKTYSDVFVNYLNYLPVSAKAGEPSKIAGCEVSQFPLLDRNIDANVRFHGKVLGFTSLPAAPGNRALLGTIEYDSGVIKHGAARAIKDLWMDNLDQLALQSVLSNVTVRYRLGRDHRLLRATLVAFRSSPGPVGRGIRDKTLQI